MWFKGGIHKVGFPTRSRWLSGVALLAVDFASAQDNMVPKENICGFHKALSVKITCSSSEIVMKSKSYEVRVNLAGGALQGSKIFWGSRLYLSYIVNGALTFIQTTVYDLRTGKKTVNEEADIVYFDQSSMVFLYTSHLGQQHIVSPVIYVYFRNRPKLYGSSWIPGS